MYVKEMNIEVKLSTQKIAGNRTRKLLDQEIDWLLNKCQERFIRSRVTPKKDGTGGFEILQDDLDAIRPLVKTGVVLPAYVADPRRIRCPLPGDYAYLTQDESVIKRTNPTPSAPQPTTITATRYILQIPIRKSTAAIGPYYGQVQVSIGGNVVFDIGQYTIARDTNFSGFSDTNEIYNIPGIILNSVISQGWDAYWEWYQDKEYPRTIVIISSAPLTGSVIIDGVTTPGITSTTNVRIRDLQQVESEFQANRLTASNIVSSLLEVAFFGTQAEFPISELSGRSLYVYPNKTFIVSNTVISYVRKPRKISLILGTDCELAPEYHQLICDLVEEYFKAMIADPNWEVKLKDDMVRAPQ